jgi:anti-sigma factor RsiW
MQNEQFIVEISCVEVWRDISDYVDDDLDRDTKARLEYHFGHCRDCKAVLDGMRNLVALVGDDQVFEFDDRINDRLTAALSKRIAEDRSRGG